MENFTCVGNSQLFPDTAELEHRLKEARLSFLSGHASLAWYGMVFSAGFLYINSSTRERNIYTLPVLLVQVRWEMGGIMYVSFCSPEVIRLSVM